MGGMRRIERPPVQEQRGHGQMLGPHGHGQVVNQPHTIQPSRHQRPAGARKSSTGRKPVEERTTAYSTSRPWDSRVSRIIFSAVEGWFAAAAACKARYTARGFCRDAQTTAHFGWNGPTHRLPRCGNGMNSGAAVSIHHGLDELQLLPILFAKNSHLRVHQIEQRCTTRATPAKCPGRWASSNPAGWPREAARALALRPIRVNVLLCRTPDHIGPRRFGQPRVHLEPARIAREIVLVVELIRIHKNAHHHGAAQTLGGTHQFQVTFVQPTHGWHKDAARERFKPAFSVSLATNSAS